MRVIAGEFRGRLLKSPAGLDVRPTPDRLREALFNVLAPRIEGAVLVDAYAGTGAVGIEALSRGASRSIFIEQTHAAVRVIRANLSALGLETRAQVRHCGAAAALMQLEPPIDIVFIDPPYRLEAEYERALTILGENPSRLLVIVQHASPFELSVNYGRLRRQRVVRHGDNALSFYER